VPSPSQSNYQDRLFGQIAAVGGLAELDLGNLAADKATNPKVTKFAKRMVADYEKANDQLKSIAQKSNIQLSTNSDGERNKTCVYLDKLTGPQFDRAYVANQTVEHQKTAQLLAWEIGQEDAEMQRFASETLPIVLKHLRLARDLAAEISEDVSDSQSDHNRWGERSDLRWVLRAANAGRTGRGEGIGRPGDHSKCIKRIKLAASSGAALF
jgi:putative membrane protein